MRCFKYLCFIIIILVPLPQLFSQIKANVNVIIDKLPIDDQHKMRDFHKVVKNYIESANWFEEDDEPIPIEITVQMFLQDIPTNVEDRYKCEFLISSSDVQYFDKRVRFAYSPGDPLIYNEQTFEPLTGIIDFYMNMILGNEMDKYNSFAGDPYYKRALNIASLGKFTRTEYILGWTEREELIKRVFREPFKTFREMKDYYFYGLYVKEESLNEARKNIRTALDLLKKVIHNKEAKEISEAKQFLDAHYSEILDLFKDDAHKKEVFTLLMELDPERKELYQEQLGQK